MESLKEKISLASKSATPGSGKKKKRSMRRDIEKISTQLKDSESLLESMRVPTNLVTKAPVNLHPPSRSRCLEAKIAELNKKIRRACNSRNKQRLIARRDVLRAELKWGPVQLEGAFGGAYRC